MRRHIELKEIKKDGGIMVVGCAGGGEILEMRVFGRGFVRFGGGYEG